MNPAVSRILRRLTRALNALILLCPDFIRLRRRARRAELEAVAEIPQLKIRRGRIDPDVARRSHAQRAGCEGHRTNRRPANPRHAPRLASGDGPLALLNGAAKNLPNPIFAFAIRAGSAEHFTSERLGHHAKTDEWRINELRINLLRIHLLWGARGRPWRGVRLRGLRGAREK
jgi:hypothetical protein